MMRFSVFSLIILLFANCVDPILIESKIDSDILVVEGRITSETGPHIIRLTRSTRYGSIFDGEIKGETGAKLFIRDNLGNTIKLSEEGSGYYKTAEQDKGIVGREYILVIKTKFGQTYQSYPELLSAAPTIDELFYEFVEIPTESDIPISGVDVYANYNDLFENENYYKWEASGMHWIKTNPELFMPPLSQVPVPKECCEECYLPERIVNLSISSDKYYNGEIHSQKFLFLEDNGARFQGKYMLNVEQMSLTKEAYSFFSLLENQLSIEGDIFDPPPAQIRGNIINEENLEEEVIGYFYATDIVKDTLFIDGATLPYRRESLLIPDDCRVLNGATTVVPEFWR